MSSSSQYVFDVAEIDPDDVRRFGGKASGLARMAAAGLPIPPAFVVSTDGFHAYRAQGGRLPPALMEEVLAALQRLEASTGKRFAGGPEPLLVSVRSGAAVSMPGMMDTVLNLGLDRVTATHLAERMGSVPFVVDTWMRFWRMYADIVLGLDPACLVQRVEPAASAARQGSDTRSFDTLEAAVLSALKDEGEAVAAEPTALLERAIGAVFESWDSRRAKAYRKHHSIADDLGTAVTVQAMVFGNLDSRSGSGVAFTRNPNTGEVALYGEYLSGRQGEDLVAGTHTPIDLSDPTGLPEDLHRSLVTAGKTLETLYRDAVDIEFTVEAGKLHLLQVRPAKRTGAAAVRIAVDAVEEGLIAPADAVRRITPDQLRKLRRPSFDEAALARAEVLVEGLGSSPGQVHGLAILDADRAEARVAAGDPVVLMRPTTSPLDIRGMLAAAGIVTAAGGALSHAAVVSRALDKPCVAGCKGLVVEPDAHQFTIDGTAYPEGTPISIDGGTGRIYAGAIVTGNAGAQGSELQRLLSLADELSGAIVWPATPATTADSGAPGKASGARHFIALADLLVAADAIDQFDDLTVKAAQSDAGGAEESAIAALVDTVCAAAFGELGATQLHLRLPARHETMKRHREKGLEIPSRALLPLGAPGCLRAMLAGIGVAAEACALADITVLIDDICGVEEFVRFREMVAKAGKLSAGVIIRNLAGLKIATEILRLSDTLWLDVRELTRSAYGLPADLFDDGPALADYAQEHFGGNFLGSVAPVLADLFPPVEIVVSNRMGIAGVSASTSLLADLYGRGFRHFAVPPGGVDELRLALAQSAVAQRPPHRMVKGG